MHNTKLIAKNFSLSVLTKGGSMVINFVLFSLLFTCIPKEEYGTWITVSSVFVWLSYFDLGIGLGLKNRLTEALVKGEKEKARAYVSTAYCLFAVLFFLIALISQAPLFLVNWPVFQNQAFMNPRELVILLSVTLSLFCVRFVLNLINNISDALQWSSVLNIQGFATNLLILAFVFCFKRADNCSFQMLALVNSIVPIAVLSLLTIGMFAGPFRDIRPSLKYVDTRYVRPLLEVGVQFLILQVGALLLGYTNYFLISWLIGMEEVVVYEAAYKYFSIISIGFQTLTYAYWSPFTSAYVKKDYAWIRTSVKRLILAWLAVVFVGAGLFFFRNTFFTLWLGADFSISDSLCLFMLGYVLIVAWNVIFMFLSNAIGHLRVQIVLTLIAFVCIVPFAYLFVYWFKMSVEGILLASILLQLPFGIVLPVTLVRKYTPLFIKTRA